MGITVATIRAAVNTSTGTQSFTTSDLGGLTPKAAVLIGSFATADGVEADHVVCSFGVTDGTTSVCHTATAEDNVAASDNSSLIGSDCVKFITPGELTDIGAAAFSSWTTNGIIINWTTAPTSAWLLTVILFAGSDLSAKVGTTPSLGNTVDLATDVTDVGFEADCLINFATEATVSTHYFNLGIVSNDRANGISQRAIGVPWVSGQTTQNPSVLAYDIYGIMETSTTVLDWGGEYSGFDSSGYSITTRIKGGNNRTVSYLALRFGSTRVAKAKVLTHSTPTSTGDDSETGVGFVPQALFVITTLATGTGKSGNPPESGVYGISIIANNQYCNTYTHEEDASTTQTTSLSNDQSFDINEDDGATVALVGTHVSFDATGWTTNYTTVQGSARLQFVLAIEEVAGAPPPRIRQLRFWRR